jgi:hypothetical protein
MCKKKSTKKKVFIESFDPKGLFIASLDTFNALSNKEINIDVAEVSCNLLSNANRSFYLMLKYAEMTKDPELCMKRFIENPKNEISDEK